MDEDALDTRLDELIQKPSSASNDMGAVTLPDLKTLDELRRRAKADTAAAQAHGGLRFSKLVPPGAQ